MTNEVNNLDSFQPYQGTGQLQVRNGATLPIHNSGKGLLPTPVPLQLHKVLHVPKLSSNLIPVHQLAEDNSCFITFDANSFTIQDKATNHILHRGPNEAGLYQFPVLM